MTEPWFTKKEWSVIRDCISSVDAGDPTARPWSDEADKRKIGTVLSPSS